MAAAKTYPLSLVIKAVDNATAPLRAINAKIQRFTAPVAKLGNSFKAFGQEAGFGKIGSALGGVGSALGDVGKQVGAIVAKFAVLSAGAAFALYRIVRGAVDSGAEMARTADRVGLTVDAYAQLQYAAGQAGIGQEEFATAMDFFNKSLGQAKAGTGSLFTLLEKVSPAFLRQVKGAKDNGAAFDLLARAMGKLKDPTKQAALAAAAFGRSGLPMVNALKGGPEALEKFKKEFLELSGSQEQFSRESVELDQGLKKVGTAFTGLEVAIGAELFPVFTQLAGVVKDFIVANRDGIAKWAKETATEIKKWVDGGGIQRLRDDFKSFRDSVMPVIDAIGGFKTVIVALIALQLAPLIASLGGLASAFLSLGAAILTTPVGWIIGGMALLGLAVYEVYKHWDGFKKFFVDLWDTVVGAFKKAWDFIEPIVEKILNVATFGGFGGILGGAKALAGLLSGTGDARPTLGASSAAPAPANASGGGATQVQVSFENVPKGVRVSQKSDGPPVDLSLGYSMAGGG